MKTYTVGQTINFKVELKDQSGIETAAMVFRNGSGSVIQPVFQGMEAGTDKYILTYEVTKDTPPGDYAATAFYAIDKKQNREDYPYGELFFRVENNPVDTQGPELINVTIE